MSRRWRAASVGVDGDLFHEMQDVVEGGFRDLRVARQGGHGHRHRRPVPAPDRDADNAHEEAGGSPDTTKSLASSIFSPGRVRASRASPRVRFKGSFFVSVASRTAGLWASGSGPGR